MAQQALLTRLQTHLTDLQQNPSTVAIDSRLFEEADLVLPDAISQEETFALVSQLSALLQTIQQPAAPAVDLLIRLLGPFSFSDVLSFDPPVNFATGLSLGDGRHGMAEVMQPFNRLMLVLLSKATQRASDAATAATQPETVKALVNLWLSTPDTGVASTAGKVLGDLLRVDQEGKHAGEVGGEGQGLVWKRVFGDEGVYATFFEVCGYAGGVELSKSQRTLAQARVLEWLPGVAKMDWGAVSRSHHAAVEGRFGVPSDGGLLDFAALKMVDFADDVLMYRCLIDFYSDLLDSTRDEQVPSGTVESSPGLEYLISKGLHDRTANIYLASGREMDVMESMFLYGPAANYIATYASLYPNHFQNSGMPKKVNDRLMQALELSSARWAHQESPKHDLHLLASLPRATLLPQAEGSAAWQATPLSLLPSKATNPDALNTLATVFHGPPKKIVDFPSASSMTDGPTPQDELEAAAARALYLNYLSNNPRYWQDIATHADTVALKDHAIAALNCLTGVVTATWSTKPSLSLPSSSIPTPESGHLAILSPPALEYALPYLLKPPQTFANLVGGRGDAESAAYKIAAAKYDALKAFHGRLAVEVEQSPGQGYEDILATIAKRLAEGPLSREGEVGGQVGTLEL